MSFTQPFDDKYTPGDLFYGLSKPRAKLIITLSDYYTVWTNGGWIDLYELNGTATACVNPVGDFPGAIKEMPKYGVILGKDNVKNSNLTVRTKCKAGLHWATMVAKKKVHFCLDDLDGENMKAVVYKSYKAQTKHQTSDTPKGPCPEDYTGEKKRAYTGAELRWIYRNREKELVQKNVQFWLGGKACAPPWDGKVGSNLWKAYKPRCSGGDNELDMDTEVPTTCGCGTLFKRLFSRFI